MVQRAAQVERENQAIKMKELEDQNKQLVKDNTVPATLDPEPLFARIRGLRLKYCFSCCIVFLSRVYSSGFGIQG